MKNAFVNIHYNKTVSVHNRSPHRDRGDIYHRHRKTNIVSLFRFKDYKFTNSHIQRGSLVYVHMLEELQLV